MTKHSYHCLPSISFSSLYQSMHKELSFAFDTKWSSLFQSCLEQKLHNWVSFQWYWGLQLLRDRGENPRASTPPHRGPEHPVKYCMNFVDIETISKFTAVCVRCSRDYGYMSWDCFDKPFSSFADFGSLCLYASYTPSVATRPCQAGIMYRTTSLEAFLINWYQSLKWLIDGCNCAELQEMLVMLLMLFVVMFNINRCAPWPKVLWLCMSNLHHCVHLVQDEACWVRRWALQLLSCLGLVTQEWPSNEQSGS